MKFSKDTDNSPCAENRLTEHQVVTRIQLRYKISQRSSLLLATTTKSHLQYLRHPNSPTDVWNQLLEDENQGGEWVELLYLQQLIKENEAMNSSYYRELNKGVTS